MAEASLSKDTIPLDIKACIQSLVAIAPQGDPAMLAQEEHRARVIEQIQAFRQETQQTVAPRARPNRVACKRCCSRMAHHPPMWRDYCLLGLARPRCGPVAFASEVTLWDQVEAHTRALPDHPGYVLRA